MVARGQTVTATASIATTAATVIRNINCRRSRVIFGIVVFIVFVIVTVVVCDRRTYSQRSHHYRT